MNAAERFAATLKERKGIGGTGRIDPPVAPQASPSAGRRPSAAKRKRRRARNSASQLALVRLEARLQAAIRRAERAESALAAIEADVGMAWETNKRIEGLAAAAIERAEKAESKLAAVELVKAVNGKIWRLNQEIKRLRSAVKHRLAPIRRQVARRVVAQRDLAYARARIERLEEENAQLKGAR